MKTAQEKIDEIKQLLKFLGVFHCPDSEYKKGWNAGMRVLADDIKTIIEN